MYEQPPSAELVASTKGWHSLMSSSKTTRKICRRPMSYTPRDRQLLNCEAADVLNETPPDPYIELASFSKPSELEKKKEIW